jgi:photosystem II stability/assembly factor-like uncharacterized protein
MSGRISDLAVHPHTNSVYYVAVASGGIFKTSNGGTTFEPIFEKYGSYSIGCINIDPHNPNKIWVGTGEANNQRSVGYGDGVYVSEDGGKSFVNKGLKNSNHIGEIVIDPTNPMIVYVAAYGPLWDSGGERGVYKSEDGGNNWTQVLKISEHTGVADIVMDPRNPKVLYASAHQRQRKGYGYVSGGPESAIYKTEDGGKTWTKRNKGFPSGDIGRIAIAVSPINPDVLYAHLEAQEGQNGSYISRDRAASWEKVSSYSSSGLYYGKIFPDPIQLDKIFVGDVYSKYSMDGGKTYVNMPAKNVHVDNHVIWIDPKDNTHWMMGGDGGLYETFNEGQNWHFKSNLSITQFYRVATDNSFPFYNIYGGTQDNSSLGGPSRTINMAGIPNSEWFITQGGDGFESQVDWQNPSIIYAQAQHGWLVRYDKNTGERVSIKPTELENEPALRWNWDAPLLVSQHDPSRIYFGANKIYRSDDRGNDWKLISPDLTRQIDRNTLPYMGKVWSVDAVQKNTSTSIFGQSTSIAESRLNEDILYVGTDDGLVQITNDGGKNWVKVDNIPGSPKMSYVPQVICSWHDQNVAYVVFNHHRYGDFKPYAYKTKDGGKTWTSITGDLPSRGSIYTIAEDHVNPNLLFIGTDFGLFTTLDGGVKWSQLKNNFPTIAVKDLEIQRRENDLVIATFGRGFYVLDDYSILRSLANPDNQKNKIFPVKDAWLFNESNPLGNDANDIFGTQGDSYYVGQNPPIGAVIRFSVGEIPQSIKQKRKKAEKEMIEKGTLKGYPSLDSFELEDQEILPFYFLTFYDGQGQIIRKEQISVSPGINTFLWDGRVMPTHTLQATGGRRRGGGLPVLPGKYSVDISYFDGNKAAIVSNKQSFEIKSLGWATMPAKDVAGLKSFADESAKIAKIVNGSDEYLRHLSNKQKLLKSALLLLPNADMNLNAKLNEIELHIHKLNTSINGNSSLNSRQFETLPGLRQRLSSAMGSIYGHNSDVPMTQKKSLDLVKKQFKPIYDDIVKVDKSLTEIQNQLKGIGLPALAPELPKWD